MVVSHMEEVPVVLDRASDLSCLVAADLSCQVVVGHETSEVDLCHEMVVVLADLLDRGHA